MGIRGAPRRRPPLSRGGPVTASMLAQAIQLILAPVLMISSCAIVSSGLLGPCAAINERLRVPVRERLELIRPGSADASAAAAEFRGERLGEIEEPLPLLLQRPGQIQRGVLAMYAAV